MNQCFADNMTVMIKETKENLIYIRDIFVKFSEISRLEINEGKTKIIRIGTRLDDLEPTTDEEVFKYENVILLGVSIDNKLKKWMKSFKKEHRKLRQKLFYGGKIISQPSGTCQ